jgi:hypothetical protein
VALPVRAFLEYWSIGALQNMKFQAPHLRVSGVREEKQKH